MKKLIEYLKIVIDQLSEEISNRRVSNINHSEYLNDYSILYKVDFNSLCSDLGDKIDENSKNLLENLIVFSKINHDSRSMLFPLTNEQNEFLKQINSLVQKSTIVNDEFYKKYQEYKKILHDLKSSHFTDFDGLMKLFEERHLSYSEQKEILDDIIKNNRNYLLVEDDEIEELVEYDNSISILNSVLSNYNLDFSLLDDRLKNKMIKYVNINNMCEVFDKLESIVPGYVINLFNTDKSLFVKVAISSSVEIIEDLEKKSLANNIDIVDVLNTPNFLYSSKIKISSLKETIDGRVTYDDPAGAYDYYIGTINLLKEKGINVQSAFHKNPTLFKFNPKILRMNFDVFEFYGMRITSADSLTGIKYGTANQAIDRFIETTPLGYEYIKDNNSQVAFNMDYTFHKLYYLNKNGVSFFDNPNGRYLIRQNAMSEFLKRRNIKNTKDIREELGISKYYISEEKQRFYETIKDKNITKEDMSLLENDYVKYLEENCRDNNSKLNRYVYLINGTRISRLKVFRVLKNLKDAGVEIGEEEVQYALAFNSILDQDDIKNIDNFMNCNINSRRSNNATLN